MTKPNTLEAWYDDAIRFLYQRYRYESTLFLEDVHGRFNVRVARRWNKFDPARGKAFTYLCWMVRGCYSDAKRRQKSSTDPMVRMDCLVIRPTFDAEWGQSQEGR